MSESFIGGHYRVIGCLRTTRFSETYKAEDTHLFGNALCVVKKLQPQSNQSFVLDTARRLFENEGKTLQNLGNHPRIPRLLAYFEENKNFYLVQEYIQGEDLSKEIVADKKIDREKVIELLQQVLEILDFVHKNGVIHRDIKPSNLIRRESDAQVVLIDFGAVKEITNPTVVARDEKAEDLTVAVGTFGYMPPEQQMGRPRYNSDLYALGMTAIQALTGIHPNDLPRDKNTDEVVWRDLVKDSSRRFRSLADLLDRMVRRNFTERYQTAEMVLKDLSRIAPSTRIVNTQPNHLRPQFVSRWKLALLSVVALLVGGAILIVPRILSVSQALSLNEEGNSQIDAGNYEEAVAAFDRALKIQPRFPQALTNRGFALGKMQRYLEKFSSCDKATQVAPQFAEAWNCKGLARFELKQYELALEEYENAIEADPNSLQAWFNKGQALLQLKRYEESLEASRRVLLINQDYFLAWTQTCRVLYELQRYQEAKINCEKSLKLKPDYQPTKQLLDRIEGKLKN
jgi:serine/threonine protein kinase